MAIEKKDLEYIKKSLNDSKNPLFFFDDDADGLCSFLLLYRYKKEGHGVPINARSKRVAEMMIRKVDEYSPDLIFILDCGNIEEEFLEAIKTPIILIDHHPLKKIKGVKYFNPLFNDPKDNRPTSYWCYEIVKKDMWIAMMGCIGDYYVPDFFRYFEEKYPNLCENNNKNPESLLFETKIGFLTRICWFNLKGKSSDVKKSIKILTRIQNPEEILNSETSQAKFIRKRYEKINEEYQKLILETQPKIFGKIKIYEYPESKSSMTSFLANELQYKNPNDIVLVCRLKGGEYKCSMRANYFDIHLILQKALRDVRGYGGGHQHAVGCVIKKEDFKKFIKNISDIVNLEQKDKEK